jgi:rfaE bifunctional protein kinase chain/domain
MTPARFQAITEKYASLRIAVVGDFCLDRYLEIDPTKQETSIETGLPVHNVVNVRAQPGGAGTILNNLVALGIGEVWPIGLCGEDGEGYELSEALRKMRGVQTVTFIQTPLRRTFTYCKPLIIVEGNSPVELNRLDSKNWTRTPAWLQGKIVDALKSMADGVNAVVLLDQVDVPETGVVTQRVLAEVRAISQSHASLTVIGDSRRGLRGWPPVIFKMNAAELCALTGIRPDADPAQIGEAAQALAARKHRQVFVTLSERGIIGAAPTGEVEHVPALPVRGPIDIVGAGDAVTANLTAALAAGATLRESLELANAAASIVIHQLGTTGTASVPEIRSLLFG